MLAPTTGHIRTSIALTKESRQIVEAWRREYTRRRPHWLSARGHPNPWRLKSRLGRGFSGLQTAENPA